MVFFYPNLKILRPRGTTNVIKTRCQDINIFIVLHRKKIRAALNDEMNFRLHVF